MPTLRRGLPRIPGGEPWPPAAESPPGAVAIADDPIAEPPVAAASVATPPVASSPVVERGSAATETKRAEPSSHAGARALRRGLPRVAGGEPWPPAGAASMPSTPSAVGATSLHGLQEPVAPVQETAAATSLDDARVAAPPTAAATVTAAAGTVPLRRGLPRASGGDPWPPAGFAPAERLEGAATATRLQEPAVHEAAAAAPEVEPAASAPPRRTGLPRPAAPTVPATASAPVPSAAPVVAAPETLAPLPFPQTVFPTASSARWNAERVARQGKAPLAPTEPRRYGPFTRLQWAGAVIVGGAGLLFAAAMAVLAVRWFLSLEFMQDFLHTYPGEYHLPEGAPVGIPGWLGWQHFFNVFLMVLIIRTGLQVRTEKRPTVFWSPNGNPKRKISLNLWFHQSLDILWLINGVVFVVLLFVTGQWMKIVPTSWEVLPNALSAGLQYVSLDWPTENGWVNYNSLQQLAYFATVFLAAPLAALTGVRMSGVWPKGAKALNRAYPVEWARAVHFPVMLYFVVFIAIHVFLVFATGALRNLNHMYASQGSTDPNAYADNWTGFWLFTASLIVIAAAWIAARPLVLAPIARLFGKVSGR